ncbi:hypothetical protein Hanom_Chr13g01205341 [Helianthus anomalus]
MDSRAVFSVNRKSRNRRLGCGCFQLEMRTNQAMVSGLVGFGTGTIQVFLVRVSAEVEAGGGSSERRRRRRRRRQLVVREPVNHP